MARTLVMARATGWVDAVIPYSQTGWANLDGVIVDSPSLGWRRDCSGFASMAWNLPMPGASTRTLASYADSIQKDALLPGDMMLKSGEHAVIFGGWTGSERTHYWAYEMSASQSDKYGDGSVRRETPYPYWGEDYGYQPYRLKGITDDIDYSAYVKPIQGADRYATAVEASKAGFAAAGTVILASGENWPDALGASALAGAVSGPVLLTRAASVPDVVKSEIKRLGATRVIVVGGEQAVSDSVIDGVEALGSIETTRLGGATRYETSRIVAVEAVTRSTAEGRPADGAVFITTGSAFPDALAASPIAYRHIRPIVLTEPAALSPDAAAAVESLGAKSAIVLGGTNAVSDAAAGSLATLLGGDAVTRISGADRYQTALALASHAEDSCCLTYAGAALSNGGGFADALAGGVMAGRLGTVLLLTPGDRLYPGVAEVLTREKAIVRYVRCLGGTAAISTLVRQSVALALQE
jgi:putative cell wall-binding protein